MTQRSAFYVVRMDLVIVEKGGGGRKLFSSSFASCKEKEMDWEDRERSFEEMATGLVMV